MGGSAVLARMDFLPLGKEQSVKSNEALQEQAPCFLYANPKGNGQLLVGFEDLLIGACVFACPNPHTEMQANGNVVPLFRSYVHQN